MPSSPSKPVHQPACSPVAPAPRGPCGASRPAAAAAGFQPGDIVVDINGRKIANFSDMQRIVGVNDAWRSVLTEAFAPVRDELQIEMPLDALVSLVSTFNEGIMLERLSGIESGQRELLAWIEELLERP